MIADKPEEKDAAGGMPGWYAWWNGRHGWYGWNGNVTPQTLKQNLKRAVFTALFFCSS
jgi:hypothetical protein